MKYFHGIFIAMIGIIAIFIAGTNYVLLHLSGSGTVSREYRVEINRLAGKIEKSGLESITISDCHYVTAIVKDMSKAETENTEIENTETENADNTEKWVVEKDEGHIRKQKLSAQDFFTAGDSDYLIKEIGGAYYRFEYKTGTAKVGQSVIIMVDLAFFLIFLLVILFLLFIKHKILKPFFILRELPIELSKGNLTMPIKENKSRFFGRFVWGMNLLRENLEQQKQRELELQKEKKTMVLSISHDIKTPLSAIKLYAKALSKGLYQDKEKQIEAAENINQKADEIERYVSDIIKAEREDFLELPVKKGEFYLSQLIKPVEEFYADKLTYLKTEFHMAPYTECLLNGDVERAIEVVQNIVENAIKYGDGNNICIENAYEEDCLLITIKNSGCTLNEMEEPHIFDSFWRGQNAEKVAGSGLGLYICKELMHKMDGEVFSKIEGKTMCVTVVFRLAS